MAKPKAGGRKPAAKKAVSKSVAADAGLAQAAIPASLLSPAQIESIVDWRNADPFAVLGMHVDANDRVWIRCFLPGAVRVSVSDTAGGEVVATLALVHPAGLFDGLVRDRGTRFGYQFLVSWTGDEPGHAPTQIDDPYHYGPLLGDTDLWWLSEGTHLRPYERLGAHPLTVGESAGTSFAVWAPNASVVSVIGDFNLWDERRHPMRLRSPAGIWELFIPGVGPGSRYKFALRDKHGHRLPDHADPFARQAELRPATASIVAEALLPYDRSVGARDEPASDDAMVANAAATRARNAMSSPISIYEVHLGSWRRVVEEENRFLNWNELGDQLIPYAVDLGFTHLELLPISEHPFDGSWGYQPTGLFAPTARFGSPQAFKRFVDRCHEAGLGVLLDWVPGHFPNDAFALAQFDGTHLYDHADPREGVHRDWGTLIYNFGRNEVRNFLIGNARFWIEQFGIDGLRVDAVASMLYRDYSRQAGEWLPNHEGGRENLEAIGFLKTLNETLGASHPEVTTIAEESTAWLGVSRPTSGGGLGFHYKWNMGWMNDTLKYMSRDPLHRRYHQSELSFGLVYAFDENFVLPLSHDEVVHGKRSLIGRMPGDDWQRFANLRLYYTFMFTHPGKKLLFMGAEFAQESEWNHDRSLDWHLLGEDKRRGVQSLVRDLNRLYRGLPALHEMDAQPDGFAWIAYDDVENSLLSYVRRSTGQTVVVVCNFTPVPREAYRIGVPIAGRWVERLNSDSMLYGGSNMGNEGLLVTQAIASHGHPQSLALRVPPLGALVFEWIE